MALEQKLNLRLSQRLVMTPSLQQAIKLLQMSQARAPGSPHAGDGREPAPRGAGGEPGDSDEPERAETEAATAPRRHRPTTPAPEKERDSFEEIDFDSYFEDYLDAAYNPRQYQEEPEEFPLENTLTRPPRDCRSTSPGSSRCPTRAPRDPGDRRVPDRQLDEDGYLRVSRDEIRAASSRTRRTSTRRSRWFDPSTLPESARSTCRDCLLLQLVRARHREPAGRDDHPRALARVPEPAVRAAREVARRRRWRRSRRSSRSSRTSSRSRAASTRTSGRSTSSRTSSSGRSETSTSSSSTRTACRSCASRRRTGGCSAAATARSAPRPPTTSRTRCARRSG